MPPLPSVLRTIRITFQFTSGPNTRIFCRIFFQYSLAMAAADAVTVLTTIRTAFQTNVMPQLSVGVNLTNVFLVDLNSATGTQTVQQSTTVGGVAGTVYALGTAWVIQSHILRRYRGSHARTYLPGVPVSATSDPTNLSVAARGAMQTAWGNFINAAILAPPAGVGVLQPVQVSYFAGFTNVVGPSGRSRPRPTVRATPLVEQIQTATVNGRLASQRRRNLQSL
jgi:hypothetical protein